MSDYETLWRFKTRNFTVDLSATPEDAPDLSWDDTAEARAKVKSGEWQCVCFRVRVLFQGHAIGSSYLGDSIYADLHDFRREHIGLAAKSRADGCNYGSYFPQMVRDAIQEARKYLSTLRAIRLRNT